MSNNEIEVHNPEINPGGALEVLPPRAPATATARQVLRDHAELATMAYDFATKLVPTTMVPDRFRNKPEEATAAILYGAELGLGPIQALQNVFAVHGSPAIYARTAQALLEAKGFQFKTIRNTHDVAEVHGWDVGRNKDTDPADQESTWTIADVEQAGWLPTIDERTGKYRTNAKGNLIGNEKYLTQPKQMLYAKSVMEVCRRLSPATLLGIAYSVEDLESESPIREAPAPAVKADLPAEEPLTVDEILSAGPDSPTGSEEPKGRTSRVDAALAKARKAADASRKADAKAAAKAAAPPAPEPSPITSDQPDRTHVTWEGPNPETEPESDGNQEDLRDGDPDAADDADDAAGGPEDSSLKGKEPTWDNMLGNPDAEPEPAAAAPDPLDERPAIKKQLGELAVLIAGAGFQPTDEGRAEWFAWLSQEVGRNITANNQLKRWEVDKVIQAMTTDDGSGN